MIDDPEAHAMVFDYAARTILAIDGYEPNELEVGFMRTLLEHTQTDSLHVDEARRLAIRFAHTIVALTMRDTEMCDDCGMPYDYVYTVTDAMWADLHERAPGGLLCLPCCNQRAQQRGIKVRWVPIPLSAQYKRDQPKKVGW